MTFTATFKDVANFSMVYKAKKTGVAKQDLARKHLRNQWDLKIMPYLRFQGCFDIIPIFLLIQILA